MFVDIGRLASDGLYAPSLGVVVVDDDTDSLRLWKTFRRRAIKSMLRGSIIVAPLSNFTKADTTHRYSAGALRHWESGLKLFSLTGAQYWDELRPQK